MKVTRLLILVSLATALVISGGGVTSLTADRSVSLAIASDDSAFLGLETDGIQRCGIHKQFYKITNQFEKATLTHIAVAVISADGVNASITSTPTRLNPGEAGYIGIKVSPGSEEQDDTEPGTVTVHIAASGSEVYVSLNRTVEAYCAKSSPSGSN